jgi:C1A family cysteine protease
MSNSGCGTGIDHSVTMVAFDADASSPYWTIKNSWGTGWGNKGYMNIEKGT